MSFSDFVVPYNENTDELAETILDHALMRPLEFKKPRILLIAGDSSEGKSETAQKLAYMLFKRRDIEYKKYINDVTIYTPIEYPSKMNRLLYDKELKALNIMIIDEARWLIKSKNWQSFLNQTIADINATFRSIKPMLVIIVTQEYDDVDKDVRKTIHYFGECVRPLGNLPVRFKLIRLIKDRRNPMKVKYLPRKLFGFVVKDGVYIRVKPDYFEINRVPKEISDIYEDANYLAKGKIIKVKLEQLLKRIEKDLGGKFSRVDSLVTHYINPANRKELLFHTEFKRGKYRLKQRATDVLNLTHTEAKEFLDQINQRIGGDENGSEGNNVSGSA